MRTFIIILVLICASCATITPSRQSAVDQAFAVVADHAFPEVENPHLVKNLMENSRTEIWNSEEYGCFYTIYADIRTGDSPYGIRSISGSNGQNFVFRLADGSATLVYGPDFKHVENRLELSEAEGELFLFSYAHSGLTAGAQTPYMHRWNGVRFERVSR